MQSIMKQTIEQITATHQRTPATREMSQLMSLPLLASAIVTRAVLHGADGSRQLAREALLLYPQAPWCVRNYCTALCRQSEN